MNLSETIDPTLLGAQCPCFDKLSIWILQDAPGTLDITLLVPLDPASPDEAAMIEQFAPDDHILDLRYKVDLNLAAERNALATRIEATYRKHPIRTALRNPELASIDDDQLRSAFMPIATLGYSIYRRLFQPKRYMNYSDDDTVRIRAAVLSALARRQIIVVKSPVSLFPWSFLYDSPDLEDTNLTTFDALHFWGFRHQIQEEVDGASRYVLLSHNPHVVAAVCNDVDTTGEHRSGPLGSLSAHRSCCVDWISSTSSLQTTLKQFPGDCLYFFGHAAQDDPPTPTTSYLQLDGLRLTVDSIDRAGGPQFVKKLVFTFFNGCETAPLNVWNRDSLAGFFCLQEGHKVCCVTTFAEIPIAFGSRFGQIFWGHFLHGSRLGEALLQARTELFQQYRNPLGLLYTIFGRVETRFE